MLLEKGRFFVPTYPLHIAQIYRFSHSPLHRDLRLLAKTPSKPHTKRTYATQRPDFGGSSANGSGTGIPLGQLNLGAGKVPAQKGVAIKDDISKSWKELSIPQKIVRTGTQTTNFAVVVVAVGVLGVVIYYLTVAVFLPTSETAIFSKAFERVRNDPQMKRLIGEKMKAYGENSGSRWARNRQIASLHRLDPQNIDHLFMRFYVEGENGKATVRLEMTKGEHDHEYKYRFLFVEFDPLPGFAPKRIYLENVADRSKSPAASMTTPAQQTKGLFGIKWGFDQGGAKK